MVSKARTGSSTSVFAEDDADDDVGGSGRTKLRNDFKQAVASVGAGQLQSASGAFDDIDLQSLRSSKLARLAEAVDEQASGTTGVAAAGKESVVSGLWPSPSRE